MATIAKTSRRANAALRLGQRIGANRDSQRFIGVERLDELAAELGVVLIDDGDRQGAKQLAEIRLRIEQAIDQRREHDQAEDAANR